MLLSCVNKLMIESTCLFYFSHVATVELSAWFHIDTVLQLGPFLLVCGVFWDFESHMEDLLSFFVLGLLLLWSFSVSCGEKNVAIVYEHSSIHNQLALFSICFLVVVISWQVIKFVIIFLYLSVFVNMWQNIWVCIESSNPFKS